MYEGKIIRFYRNKAKLTQDQLGAGICSKSHVCKIENGQAEYSSEILTLLAKRLGIDMEEEIKRYNNIGNLLHLWNDAMISENNYEIDRIKNILSEEKLIHISDYHAYYLLLKARYSLYLEKPKEAHKIIKAIQKEQIKLSSNESNLLKHVFGMYHIANGDYISAVDILRKIDIENYNNPEYYYYLASAYRNTEAQLKAYYYAEKALQFFMKTNRFLRVIDTETLLLTLTEKTEDDDFQGTVGKYQSLIQSCELCNDIQRKIKLQHNLAFEYFRRTDFKTASRVFQQLLEIPDNKYYFSCLYSYISSCLEIGSEPKSKLVELSNEGVAVAKEKNDSLYIELFKLLVYEIKGPEAQYYQHLDTKTLPFLRKNGYIENVINRFEADLLSYYIKTSQNEKAFEIARSLLKV
jgi:HTH-type transcriptional regulator, quorum sensing regulator NprR